MVLFLIFWVMIVYQNSPLGAETKDIFQNVPAFHCERIPGRSLGPSLRDHPAPKHDDGGELAKRLGV